MEIKNTQTPAWPFCNVAFFQYVGRCIYLNCNSNCLFTAPFLGTSPLAQYTTESVRLRFSLQTPKLMQGGQVPQPVSRSFYVSGMLGSSLPVGCEGQVSTTDGVLTGSRPDEGPFLSLQLRGLPISSSSSFPIVTIMAFPQPQALKLLTDNIKTDPRILL